MTIRLTASLIAAAMCFCGAALAGPVSHLTCRYAAGGQWWDTLSLTIDYKAKTVEGDGADAEPGTVKITKTTVGWSVMRGFLVLDRKSGKLDWDMTAEYDYLAAIDQPSKEAEANFKGSMQCKVGGKPKS